MYPNPAANQLFFDLGSATAGVTITDMSGRVVYTGQPESAGKRWVLSLDGISPGAYLVSVNDGAEVFRGKLVVGR
jgi:hypothetical protein